MLEPPAVRVLRARIGARLVLELASGLRISPGMDGLIVSSPRSFFLLSHDLPNHGFLR